MTNHRLITTGCSFTAGSSDLAQAIAEKNTWVHYLLEPWQIKILVNLAIPGGGNIASSFNLKWFLMNHKEFSCDNTTILFNLTGLGRYDLLVDPDHPDANQHFSWANYCGFSWITSGGFVNKNPYFLTIQQNSGYENFVKLNQMAIIDLFTFIELHNFKYAFMCMDNDILNRDKNDFFSEFIDKRQDKLIKFKNYHMHEYCRANGLLADDGFHPGTKGYQEIANHVIDYFDQKA